METAATAVSNILEAQNIFKLVKFLNLVLYLWPSPAKVKDGSTYDFVIIGGGTAGCVVASRLAKLNVSVLLVEAGGMPPVESVLLPAMFPLLKDSEYDWNFTSAVDKDAYKYQKGNVAKLQQGLVLGGSGQVNYLLYGKGIPEDYNKWAKMTNDSSWHFKKLCKLFKKIEKVVDKKIINSEDIKFHGTEGKIKLRKYYPKRNEEYFEAYSELGQETVLDINPSNPLGYTNAYSNIGNRVRQSTAYSYLSPEKKNSYLSVMYNSIATEILIDDKKTAIGVKILSQSGKIITVKVNKEVILTAGAIKSPQVLMLSGIGPKAHLEQKDIQCVADLPVGKNFQDHPSVILIYKMGPAEPFTGADPTLFPVSVIEGYVALKSKCKPDYQILSGIVDSPEFFLQACVHVFNVKNNICDLMANEIKGRQAHFVTHSLLYPKSRGEILLMDKDPEEDPIIKPGYYSDETDLTNHAKYIQHYNQVLNTTFYKNVNADLVYPKLKNCDNLQRGTREYWECYVKAMSSTLHMYFGTCALGSVVDSSLQVIGVQKLRVADSSVIPSNIGSTIELTTIMIAEKLVKILKKEYSLL